MNNAEKLVAIFTPEFVQANADLDSVDAIYEKVAEIEPEISKDEVVDFLTNVSVMMNQDEISENELDNVAGGIGLLAIAAGIGTVCGVFIGTYTVGTAIGKTIKNLKG